MSNSFLQTFSLTIKIETLRLFIWVIIYISVTIAITMVYLSVVLLMTSEWMRWFYTRHLLGHSQSKLEILRCGDDWLSFVSLINLKHYYSKLLDFELAQTINWGFPSHLLGMEIISIPSSPANILVISDHTLSSLMATVLQKGDRTWTKHSRV